MKSLKGNANMWWIIIGAVIALVVMIVLMVMFTSKTSRVEGGLLDCESKGGSCQWATSSECREIGKGTPSGAFECKGDWKDYICCFGSEKDNTD